MGVNKSSNRWGGKRDGSGRKRSGKKLALDSTKVIRVGESEAERIKAGKYLELISALYDARDSLEKRSASRKSPRNVKMWELMDRIDGILGTDYENWIL